MIKSELVAQFIECPDKDDPLVIAPSPDLDELRTSGSASIDLRLGCWFAALRQARSSILDLGDPQHGRISEHTLTKSHYVCFGDTFILHPRSFVLGVTMEWLRLPGHLGGYVTSRSSWGRRGLVIATATGVHPGFIGCLTLELANVGEIPIALYPGMAICQLFLHRVEGRAHVVNSSLFMGRRKPLLGTVTFDSRAKRLSVKD